MGNNTQNPMGGGTPVGQGPSSPAGNPGQQPAYGFGPSSPAGNPGGQGGTPVGVGPSSPAGMPISPGATPPMHSAGPPVILPPNQQPPMHSGGPPMGAAQRMPQSMAGMK